MDPLSITLGVIPLVLQLGKGINKLSGLLHEIQDAPSEVEWIIEELDFLEMVLHQIKLNDELHGSQAEVQRALQRFAKPLRELGDIAESLAPGFASGSGIRRKWTAMEVVRKKEQVRQFKYKLAEAKTSLILTQSLSSSRVQNGQYRDMSRALDDIQSRFSCQGRVTVSYQEEDEVQMTERTSTEIRSLCSSWPLPHLLQPVLEDEFVRASERTTASSPEPISDAESRAVAANGSGGVPTNVQRKQQLGSTRLSVTRTPFGEVRCLIKKYKVVRPWDTDDGEADDSATGNYERETSVRFMPSAYVVRLGIKAIQMSTQGLQAKLRFFNLVPDDSLIFDFCRQGNVGAIRVLLQKGLASIDDINGYHETPLHVAAASCQPEVCSLLLNGGADLNAEDINRRIPFTHACSPGIRTGTSSFNMTSVTQRQMTHILYEFLKNRDLDDVDKSGEALPKMIRGFSLKMNEVDHLKPEAIFQWIMGDLLPITSNYILGQQWWESCLFNLLHPILEPRDPFLATVLRNCSIQGVQGAFLDFISRLGWGRSAEIDMQWKFNELTEKCGGICFLQEQWGVIYSPLSKVIQRSAGFEEFRSLSEASGYDIAEVAEREIELHGDGWRKKNLLSLLKDKGYPRAESERAYCKSCSKDSWSPVAACEYPWKQRVRRCKYGIKLDAPLSKHEKRCQNSWNKAVEQYVAGNCWSCYVKKDKFALEMRRQRCWSI